MHALIVTAGSWGDVAPYTGLGVRLHSMGHEVTLATHERFEQAVTAHGLGFRALPVDPRQEPASQVGQGPARAVSPPVAMARVARMARAFMPRLTGGVADAVRQGADVVLSSTVTDPMCAALGEALGLPSIGVYLQPVQPTGAFRRCPPAAARSDRTATALPPTPCGPAPTTSSPPPRRPAPRTGAAAPEVRRHAGPATRAQFPARLQLADRPPPDGLAQGHEVCGYWWPQPPPGWEPDQRLLDFLDAGPPPVFAGFGSFVTADAERLSTLLADAMRRARVRGIIQAGWSGLHAENDDLITVQEVPHAWLFPRTAAVIHHAGATEAGLRAGVPSVPVPVQLDQHFWAPGHRRRPRPRRRHTPSPYGH
ncbi:glycosyltransferase [Streptomyces sp. NPDC050844]|uniref:glycosyltransferase n=1 Tax=Streptomyces sp. NPDC050844 TaxID=3155790 RepID=UPI00340E5FE6